MELARSTNLKVQVSLSAAPSAFGTLPRAAAGSFTADDEDELLETELEGAAAVGVRGVSLSSPAAEDPEHHIMRRRVMKTTIRENLYVLTGTKNVTERKSLRLRCS